MPLEDTCMLLFGLLLCIVVISLLRNNQVNLDTIKQLNLTETKKTTGGYDNIVHRLPENRLF